MDLFEFTTQVNFMELLINKETIKIAFDGFEI